MKEEGFKITFSEYQREASKTAIYPFSDAEDPAFVHEGILYLALGLAGEAGEVANKIKKIVRDSDGLIEPGVRGKIVAELGDVLWYVSELARLFGTDLGLVAQHNLSKLSARHEQDLISGTGDYRERPMPQSVGEAIARSPEIGTFGDEVDVEERRNREVI